MYTYIHTYCVCTHIPYIDILHVCTTPTKPVLLSLYFVVLNKYNTAALNTRMNVLDASTVQRHDMANTVAAATADETTLPAAALVLVLATVVLGWAAEEAPPVAAGFWSMNFWFKLLLVEELYRCIPGRPVPIPEPADAPWT